MYEVEFEEKVKKKLSKLADKDKRHAELISKTIKKIQKNPFSSKPLKKPMQGLRREHLNPFVLIFSINEKNKTIKIENYKHHDEIYRRN